MILLVPICTTENDDLPVMCTAKIIQFCPDYCRMASFVSSCTAENKLPFEFSTKNSRAFSDTDAGYVANLVDDTW